MERLWEEGIDWQARAEKGEARMREMDAELREEKQRVDGYGAMCAELEARVAELGGLRDRVLDLVLEANMVRTPPGETARLLGQARNAMLDDRDTHRGSDSVSNLQAVERAASDAGGVAAVDSPGAAEGVLPAPSLRTDRAKMAIEAWEADPDPNARVVAALEREQADLFGPRPSEPVALPLGPPLQFSAAPGTFEEVEACSNEALPSFRPDDYESFEGPCGERLYRPRTTPRQNEAKTNDYLTEAERWLDAHFGPNGSIERSHDVADLSNLIRRHVCVAITRAHRTETVLPPSLRDLLEELQGYFGASSTHIDLNYHARITIALETGSGGT